MHGETVNKYHLNFGQRYFGILYKSKEYSEWCTFCRGNKETKCWIQEKQRNA